MRRVQRISTLALLGCLLLGAGAGLLVQALRSSLGLATLVPPLSLSLTPLTIAAVLLALGRALQRAVTRQAAGTVNPFHAVRLLAAARAGQLVGVLLTGFGGGLALQLLARSMLPSTAIWLPMLGAASSGVVLLLCSLFTERCCRLPPTSGDAPEAAAPDESEPTEPNPGIA